MAPNTEPNVDQNLNSSTPPTGATPTPVTPSPSAPVSSPTNPAQPTTTNPDYAFPAAGSPESLAEDNMSAPDTSLDSTETSGELAPEPQQNVDPLAPVPPVANTPEYIPDAKPKKKLLKTLIPVLILLVSMAAGGFFYLKTQRTSAATLREFSAATSELSSEASSLSSKVSNLSTSSSAIAMDVDLKAFDESVANLESKVAKLKSDRKALKTAAENYIKELKSYRETNIMLAIDASKVGAVMLRFSGTLIGGMVTVTSPADYSARLSTVMTEIDGRIDELNALELTNPNAKEYRDNSVEFMGKIKEIFVQIKAAIDSGDREAVLAAQTKVQDLTDNSSAIKKEKEILDMLSPSSDASKKVEAARDALNNEIDKVNKSR